jgi:tetratricopeptide (TPR) repeat protein
MLAAFGALCGCASAPKQQASVVKVDPRQAELEPFLDRLEADEDAAEEEGREPRRRLLAGRMLLAGKGIDDVLLAAQEKGEPDLLRAVLLARKGAFDQALAAARRGGGDTGLRLSVAVLLAANETAAAKQLLEGVPDSGSAKVLSAWLAHRDGRTEEAVKVLRKHLFDQGRDLFAYLTLARIHQEEGKARLARLVCKEGLKQAPKNADLHYMLGGIEQGRGRAVAAARAFDSALKVEPGHLGALLDRSRMHLEGLDYVAALALTARAFRLAPKDPQVALTHALAMRANGNCDGAEQLLLAWQDRQPVAIYNLGVLKLRCRDDAAAALVVFKQFVATAKPDEGHPVHQLLTEAEALAE